MLWVVSEIAVPDFGIQFLYAAGLLTAIYLALFVVLSLADGADEDDSARLGQIPPEALSMQGGRGTRTTATCR